MAASRTSVDPLATMLKMTPLSESTQSHMRRVYTTLATGVGAAAAGAVLQQRLSLPAPAFLSTVAVMASMFYFLRLPPRDARRYPAFIGLTALNGYATGPLLSLVADIEPSIPMIAFASASSIFFCLSAASLLSRRRHWLYLGGMLGTAITGLLWMSVISIFLPSAAAFSVQIYLGLLVFCGYVIYDSQVIVEKVENGDKDHVQHAFDLFVDLAAIFKRILIIMAKNALKKNQDEERRRRR